MTLSSAHLALSARMALMPGMRITNQCLRAMKKPGSWIRASLAYWKGSMAIGGGQVIAYKSVHPGTESQSKTESRWQPASTTMLLYLDQMLLFNLKYHLDINEDLSLDTIARCRLQGS